MSTAAVIIVSVYSAGTPGWGVRTITATLPSVATEATCRPPGSHAIAAPIALCNLGTHMCATHPSQFGLLGYQVCIIMVAVAVL